MQSGVLDDLLGDLTPLRIGLAMAIGGGLSLGIVAIVLFWRRRSLPKHPVERIFSAFAQRLAAQGFPRRPEESPAGFVSRLAHEVGLSEAQIGGLVAELDTLPDLRISITQLRSRLGAVEPRHHHGFPVFTQIPHALD